MPEQAEILSVGWQGPNIHELQIWALVDPAAEYEQRKIAIYGTGNPVPEESGEFIGTVIQPGLFVWHVFEES